MGVPEQAADERERLLGHLAAVGGRRAFAIARDLLGNPAEAEDAVQEGLARACESLESLRDSSAAEAWFYRIVTNVCLRVLRRRRIRRVLLGKADGSEAPRQDSVDPDAPDRHDIELLLGALDQLPAKQKAALVLRYGHDVSVNEVAELLGVKRATAKTHLVRGLDRLRTILETAP